MGEDAWISRSCCRNDLRDPDHLNPMVEVSAICCATVAQQITPLFAPYLTITDPLALRSRFWII